VRKAARERKGERFTALLHHVTPELLRASFYALKREAAAGVDGVRWKEYETGLEGRLADLHSRVHRGGYRAQPSRRVYIPKADGRQRPLGIAALEVEIEFSRTTGVYARLEREKKRYSNWACLTTTIIFFALPRIIVADHGGFLGHRGYFGFSRTTGKELHI